MQAVDLILYPRWLIPVEPRETVYEDYALVVDKGHIVALGAAATIKQQYTSAEEVHLPEHALMPGFVNAHSHAAMVLLRGYADDLPLMDWLNHYIWPAEGKWVSPDMIKAGTELAVAEMFLSGTTCFHDMYFFPEVTAKVCADANMRLHVGITFLEGIETAWSKGIEESKQKGLALYDDFNQHPLINIHLAPHAPYTISDTTFGLIKELSERLNCHIQMHVHETHNEIEMSLKEYGVRPLARLKKLGLLTPQLTAPHMVHLTKEEIELVAMKGVHITHCPESNLKLGSGFCPVAALLKASVNVALGTDGAASNNDLDMIGEMRTAALLAKTVAQEPTALPAHDALQMATLNGAKALHMSDKIGSLVVGKQADMIAMDLSEVANQPMYHPISQVVYTATRQQVTDVWVAGKRVVKARQLTTLNEAAVKENAGEWQAKIATGLTQNA